MHCVCLVLNLFPVLYLYSTLPLPVQTCPLPAFYLSSTCVLYDVRIVSALLWAQLQTVVVGLTGRLPPTSTAICSEVACRRGCLLKANTTARAVLATEYLGGALFPVISGETSCVCRVG